MFCGARFFNQPLNQLPRLRATPGGSGAVTARLALTGTLITGNLPIITPRRGSGVNNPVNNPTGFRRGAARRVGHGLSRARYGAGTAYRRVWQFFWVFAAHRHFHKNWLGSSPRRHDAQLFVQPIPMEIPVNRDSSAFSRAADLTGRSDYPLVFLQITAPYSVARVTRYPP